MSELRGKSASWPAEKPVGIASSLAAGPLQESFAQLQEAVQLLRERKFDQARAICESLVGRYPNYVGALYMLGLVFSDQNENEHALDCLVRALMLSPRNKEVSTALAEVYLRLGANEMAAQTLERTQSINPPDAQALLLLGDIYQEDCQYERARETFRQALAIKPDLVPATIGLGWCCSYLGDYAEAAEAFQELIERGVRLLEPIRGLIALPASAVKIDLLAELERAARGPNEDSAEFEASVRFLRANILDRAGRYAEAWECVTRANRTVFHNMQERIGQISERWRASIDALRAKPGKVRHPENAGQTISLFILGPSRSGKTTMEQLVEKLGGVKRGYESPCVRNAVLRTFQSSSLLGSSLLELLPPHLYPLCREYYLEELERRAGSARVFTNTSPGHVHAAASIVEIFQNARFIFVKRNMEDNLLRIYMAKYRAGNAYAYELKTVRDHILQYHQIIDLMAEKFSDIVRVINYEDMVVNPADAVAVAAELCGLSTFNEPLPVLDADSGCATPYRKFMAAELRS